MDTKLKEREREIRGQNMSFRNANVNKFFSLVPLQHQCSIGHLPNKFKSICFYCFIALKRSLFKCFIYCEENYVNDAMKISKFSNLIQF